MSFCVGKERFTTFALAERVSKRRRREGTKRGPYRCRECGGYHIGSSLGAEREPRVRGESYFTVLEPA